MKELKLPIVEKFRDTLQNESTGEGGKSYFNWFRKIARQPYKEKMLTKDLYEDINPPTGEAK